MLTHRFRKPPLCLWGGKNVHTKTREYRTARQIWVARVPGLTLTTCHSEQATINSFPQFFLNIAGNFTSLFFLILHILF